jgi:hypothetical protein
VAEADEESTSEEAQANGDATEDQLQVRDFIMYAEMFYVSFYALNVILGSGFLSA